MADQTNAEVSDGRLREPNLYAEIIAIVEDCSERMKRSGESHRMFAKWVSEGVNALLNRRSVTSQASEGEDDKRQKYADAIAKLHGRDLDLYFGMGKFADGVTDDQKRAAMLAFFFPKSPASPSKRVERLETALTKTFDEWSEEDGDVVWWCWRDGEWLGEAAWIGTPLDLGQTVEIELRSNQGEFVHQHQVGGWPGYHTHWTPHPTRPQALQGGRS